MRKTNTQLDHSRSQDTHPGECHYPDCEANGEYPAPRSRGELNSYLWFCLDHVRAYNAAWNYFAGMNDEDVEAQIRKDAVWERPTWPFGGQARNGHLKDDGAFRDPFGFFSGPDYKDDCARTADHRLLRRGSAEEKALSVLDIELPLTPERLKARYKELVKLHHPDANGGDKASEERLKRINEAYATLKSCIFS